MEFQGDPIGLKVKVSLKLPLIRYKTVPGGSSWQCCMCNKPLIPGDVVVTRGKVRYCPICTAQGKVEGFKGGHHANR